MSCICSRYYLIDNLPALTTNDPIEVESVDPFVSVSKIVSNDTITVVVSINNINDLWCYQFKLSFDMQLIDHGLSDNILGKSIIGFSQYQLHPLDSNTICYAATITGMDSTKSVSGSGIIGYARFLSYDYIPVKISEVLIGGYNSEILDTITTIKYLKN
jgi:hypothetical protein